MIKIFPGYDPLFQYLIKDLECMPQCKIIKDLLKCKPLYSFWSKIHHDKKRWSVLKYLYYFIATIRFLPLCRKKSNNIYIFSNIAIGLVPIGILRKVKKNGNKIVLYFIDSLSNRNAIEAFNYTKKMKFDLIYSFDQEDSERNHFIFFPTMYSKILKESDNKIIYDAIFIGSGKNRINIISRIVQTCPNVFFYIDLTDIKNKGGNYKKIDINKRYSYIDVVRMTMASNCIIDIKTDLKQSGLSLRAYEAVVYNKKLVTNNPSIFKFPYYNEKYMLYVDDWKELNEDFLTKKVNINYHYNNEFSPINFIKDIKNRFTK